MPKKDNRPSREVALHGDGMGVATRAEIEERARQIALDNDRDPADVTDEDRRQAERELSGREGEKPNLEEAGSNVDVSRNPGETPAVHGEKAPEEHPDDEQTFEEREVIEGKEEAYHDRATEGHRQHRPPPNRE